MADFIADTFSDLKQKYANRLNDIPVAVLIPAIEKALAGAFGEVVVLRSEFERYKAEATKKEKFLLERMDQVMQTHASNFEDRAKGVAEYASQCLNVVEQNVMVEFKKVEEKLRQIDKQLAGMTDTKHDPYMK